MTSLSLFIIDNSTPHTEAIMDDINDVVDMISNNHCLEEELEDEVGKQDDIMLPQLLNVNRSLPR